jgi:hypothetical protein
MMLSSAGAAVVMIWVVMPTLMMRLGVARLEPPEQGRQPTEDGGQRRAPGSGGTQGPDELVKVIGVHGGLQSRGWRQRRLRGEELPSSCHCAG